MCFGKNVETERQPLKRSELVEFCGRASKEIGRSSKNQFQILRSHRAATQETYAYPPPLALAAEEGPAKTVEPAVARARTSGFLLATMVSTLTARRTSSTEMVPMAEDRRPAKGNTSGPR
mmetsp:Transcript_18819/g.33082  ORF Transcript_18819/g.33082 Transcript_18819/m.33082 type:complete len:120 (-) Transcript_18819:1461-1820(-)